MSAEESGYRAAIEDWRQKWDEHRQSHKVVDAISANLCTECLIYDKIVRQMERAASERFKVEEAR